MIDLSTYQPRPYQTECITALAEARNNGVQKGLVVMASGLGKTLTTIFDLQQFLKDHPGARVLCLCHQESILLQSKAKFRKVFGEEYSYGLFTGNYKTVHPVNFLFATFQTMRDHREEFPPDTFDYIVVDEAHHTAAETYQPTADYFTPQFLLGLTATKDRMDGRDILDTYDQVLYQMDIYDGWTEGWLARVDYRIMLDDLNEEEFKKYVGPHATNEKVSLSQLNKSIFAPQHDEGIVASIREQIADLDNPSIFIFCSGIGHANAMAHQFGGEAAVIHSGQTIGLNEAILSSFRSGEIRIIVSVDMLNEGIDIPEADVVVFLRATESSTIFFQQLGRGLRISGAKRTVRVLDYVANIERISMILEMEETAKQRTPASPTYSPSVNKPEPLVVNIPATKFKVERVDVETLIGKLNSNFGNRWRGKEQEIFTEIRSMSVNGEMPSTRSVDDNPNLPSSSWLIWQYETWENLAIILELEIVRKSKRCMSVDEICRIYCEKSIRKGKWLSAKEINDDMDLPSDAHVRRLIGGRQQLIELSYNYAVEHGMENLVSVIPMKYCRRTQDDGAHKAKRAHKYNWSAERIGIAVGNLVLELRRRPTYKDLQCAKNIPAASICIGKCGGSIDALLMFCGADEILNGLEEYQDALQKIDATTVQQLQKLALKLGRRIGHGDLCAKNDVPTYAWFLKKGLRYEDINRIAHIDSVLAQAKNS